MDFTKQINNILSSSSLDKVNSHKKALEPVVNSDSAPVEKASVGQTTSREDEVADPASQKISLQRSKSIMIRMTQSDKMYQELKKLKAITMP